MDDLEELLEGERPGRALGSDGVALLAGFGAATACGVTLGTAAQAGGPPSAAALGSLCATSRERGENASLGMKGLMFPWAAGPGLGT